VYHRVDGASLNWELHFSEEFLKQRPVLNPLHKTNAVIKAVHSDVALVITGQDLSNEKTIRKITAKRNRQTTTQSEQETTDEGQSSQCRGGTLSDVALPSFLCLGASWLFFLSHRFTFFTE
jgi:hypothetical protein